MLKNMWESRRKFVKVQSLWLKVITYETEQIVTQTIL